LNNFASEECQITFTEKDLHYPKRNSSNHLWSVDYPIFWIIGSFPPDKRICHVVFWRIKSPSAHSGASTLYLNDVSKQVLKNMDNDTRAVTSVRLGAQGVDAGTSGSLYFDDFVARRFTYIGLLPDPGVADITVSAQAGWNARTYTYAGTVINGIPYPQPHAVTSLSSGESYTYDANGNMTCRIEDGVTFKQVYNAENRISSILRECLKSHKVASLRAIKRIIAM
jgi:hypothetical protein